MVLPKKIKTWRRTANFKKIGTGSKGTYQRYSSTNSQRGDITINEQDGTFLVTLESFNNSRRFSKKLVAERWAKSYMLQNN